MTTAPEVAEQQKQQQEAAGGNSQTQVELGCLVVKNKQQLFFASFDFPLSIPKNADNGMFGV